MNDDQELITRFRAGVRFIDGQRKLLIDTNASPDMVEALAGIVKHLHSLTEPQVRRLLGGQKQKDLLRSRKAEEAAKVADMPLDAIQKLLDDEKTTRVQLENVAVGRFQVPRGSLRSFGNIDQLRSKVATLVRNELSHQTINKMARELKT